MNLLRRVLAEIESADGPLTVNELSHRLDVDRETLSSLLAFWVRKGRIQDNRAMGQPGDICRVEERCFGLCTGPESCPFLANQPRTYSVHLRQPGRPVKTTDSELPD